MQPLYSLATQLQETLRRASIISWFNSSESENGNGESQIDDKDQSREILILADIDKYLWEILVQKDKSLEKKFLVKMKQFYTEYPDPQTQINQKVVKEFTQLFINLQKGITYTNAPNKIDLLQNILTFSSPNVVRDWCSRIELLKNTRASLECNSLRKMSVLENGSRWQNEVIRSLLSLESMILKLIGANYGLNARRAKLLHLGVGPDPQKPPQVNGIRSYHFTQKEVMNSFNFHAHRRGSVAHEIYPWDQLPENQENFYKSSSLGKWIGEKLLERCMKYLALQYPVCILENSVIMDAGGKNCLDKVDKDFSILRQGIQTMDVANQNYIAAIINSNTSVSGHWILGIVDMTRKQIILFDTSVIASPTFYEQSFFYLLHVVHIAYCLEKKALSCDEWELIVSLDSVQQVNPLDSAPLTIANFFGILNKKQLMCLPEVSKVRRWIMELSDKCSNKHSIESIPLTNLEADCRILPFVPVGLEYSFKQTKNLISKFDLIPV